MSFEVEVTARVSDPLRAILCDLVGESAIHDRGDVLVVSVVDEAQLVSVIARLNDLALPIAQVRRLNGGSRTP